MCHGAGGLAGQYYFGARTGGTNIIEGLVEIGLGLFLASSVAGLFTLFPKAIIGAMMLLIGIEMTRFVKDRRTSDETVAMLATVSVSLATNMAFGFMAGFASSYLISHLTLTYNRIRQASITKEIIEIVSGAAAAGH